MKLRVLPALAIFASLLFSCDLLTDGPGTDDPEEEYFHVFSITPDAVIVPAQGGEFEITVVSTQSEFDITIVDNWITEITRSGDRMKGETFRFSATPNLGNLRETFFYNQMRVRNDIISSKDSDFVIGKYTFEVGGRKKGYRQIENIPGGYIVRDDTESGYMNVIPLWLFGLNY